MNLEVDCKIEINFKQNYSNKKIFYIVSRMLQQISSNIVVIQVVSDDLEGWGDDVKWRLFLITIIHGSCDM